MLWSALYLASNNWSSVKVCLNFIFTFIIEFVPHQIKIKLSLYFCFASLSEWPIGMYQIVFYQHRPVQPKRSDEWILTYKLLLWTKRSDYCHSRYLSLMRVLYKEVDPGKIHLSRTYCPPHIGVRVELSLLRCRIRISPVKKNGSFREVVLQCRAQESEK